MAAAGVDVAHLSTHLGVPEATIESLTTEPTVDLVAAVLQAISSKALEFETLYAEKLQVDIELENAVRSSEARTRQFKITAENALKDVEEARQKLRKEENARQSLENELQTLRSSTATSQSDVETLRERIKSLEASNRDTLAIVDKKNAANNDLSEELQRQHQKIVKLGQETSALSQKVQTAEAAASSANFREESLKQELELARRNNDWFENELKTKNAEALKSRKEKSARISELQRLNDDANSNVESLTRSEQQLRKRLDEAQAKADESLTKVQQLEESKARAAEGFKQELESSKRLVELKDEQAKMHQKRLQEVELRLAQVTDDSIDEVRTIQKTLEKEKEEHSQTSQHVQELQSDIDRLQAIVASQGAHPGSAPQTPRANGSTMARVGSPFGTPGSFRGKSSLRATDAIEELYTVRAQLTTEKRRNKQLQEELDDFTALLEAKAPEIDDANAEAERLRNEALNMSQIMEQSFHERDLATKAARRAEAAASKAQTEINILQTQLRDLSTQIHVLIFNIHAREKGFNEINEDGAREYGEEAERMKRGEIVEGALADLSPTHRFITERFVAFKDIYELQEKNETLLKLTRELANKMEAEAELAEKHKAAEAHEEVESLRGTVATLQDEVKSITVRMKSYMSERDMFRRMLQQKATPAEVQAAAGSLGDGSQREVLASIEHNSGADDGDLVAALRELQTQFDSYRTDQTTDRKAMTEQIERLSSEKSSLQAEISKVASQLTLATERYGILQSNFHALQNENKELQARSQTLSETSAKQDMRTQQVAQELVEVRELQESMRNENANLKAEKTLWKSIQDRLHADNENLVHEKSRLNALLSNQQSLQNERELGEAETRRRLQNQIESLDTELASINRKLDVEREESRKAQLRKEFDGQQSQKRIDELTSNLGQLKQENVAIKTSRDHLQARVDELTIEVRSAEDRASRLRPIPTPRAPPATNASHDAGENDVEARVQELETEVSDLKNSLDLANAHLENAKQQVEEYKRLSHDVEDELANITASQEQYHEEMDVALATKDSNIKALEQRMEAITGELANSTNDLNSLRDSQAEIAKRSEEKERTLTEEISRFKEQEERSKEAAKAHLQDLRDQAEIAAQAQRGHDEELLKHAEARKSLQSLRAEHNELKTQSAAWRAEAESAKIILAQSEQSWDERKQQLEQETADIKTRWEDANAQNTLLHKQLEATNSQILQIRKSRASLGESASDTSTAVADLASEGLRELNNYLRREKEILEVQLSLKSQESQRLQSAFEQSQAQLDETRLKLEQERRANADSGRASMSHKELMDKINELNIIRESNVTLRNENLRSQAQLAEKAAKVANLEAQIQPLEMRINELESTVVFKDAEIKQLQEDRERWQKRTESILQKYGQADPEEVEQLKESIESLTAERDAAKQEQEQLRGKIQELESTIETERNGWKTTREKLAEQFKSRYNDARTQRSEAINEKNELQSQLTGANEQLSSLQSELDAAKRANSTLAERNSQMEQQALTNTSVQQSAVPGPIVATQDPELGQQLENLRQELETVTSQKNTADSELDTLRSELASAIAERDQSLANAQSLQQTSGPATATQSNAAALGAATTSLTDDERAALLEQINAAESKAAEAESKAAALEQDINNVVKQRSEKMKEALNRKLRESKELLETQTQELRNKMQDDFNLKLEQERAIWTAENRVPANGIPSTPVKDAAPTTPTVATPGVVNMDLANLTDAQTRDLLANNATIKTIVANNIKKRLDSETKRLREEVESGLKAEYDQKITSAKDQATALTEKKSALKLNMLDRQVKVGSAKLGVVEKAANETPQRPVIEVWNIAKDVKLPTTLAVAPPAAAQHAPAASAAPAPQSGDNSAPAQAPQNNIPKLGTGTAPQASSAPSLPAVIPLGSSTSSEPSKTHSQPQQTQTQPSQIPQPPGARTGLPVPSRGGANAARGGRGNVYQPPGGGRGGGQGGGGGRGGRGGGSVGRGGMNAHAAEFQPGNKRPRNDSEVGAGGGAGGAKRQRGGGPSGQ